MDKFIKKN